MMFLKAKSATFGLLASAFMLGAILASAHAQQKRVTFSSTEDIAIAFYKTGNTVPNFETWIKSREPYNLTPWAKREEMLTEEKNRLGNLYRNFNPDVDYLMIRTSVSLLPEEIVAADGSKTYTLKISFVEAPDALYFPYEFLGQRIVVMPHKIDKIMETTISPGQYDLIQESIRYAVNNTMIVRLKATESDLSRPYNIDGLDQWVLKAEVVSLEVWNQPGRLLWEYTAPWYVSPNTKSLNTLFEKRPAGTNEKGSVKSLYKN